MRALLSFPVRLSSICGAMIRQDASPRRLFDTHLLPARRDRGAALGFAGSADFLHREVAAMIAERLAEVTRPFGDAAVVGSGGGAYAAALAGRVPADRIVQVEISPARAASAGTRPAAALDPLPLSEADFDLVLSGLELHWAEDPVGLLVQMRRALRPDGLMIAALFGGRTLNELRTSLAEAEVETTGGLSPRVAPMGEIRDLGSLLQRAGFALPVADAERFEVAYATPLHLMRELRAMGETNILAARRRAPLRRATLARACEIYAQAFPAPGGRIAATFEVVFLTGWAPAEGQPKPLRPGSAAARLADALGTVETGAGVRAGPPPARGAGD
jgi:SAM-dependent methyltransferase